MPSIKPIRDITNTAATPSGDEWILIDNGIDMAKAKINDAITPKATEIVEDKIAELSLGTAAAANVEDFATAAQGSKADTAVQPSDLATVATTGDYADLTNKPTFGTAAEHDVEEFATAEQGEKADTAVQPEDLAAVATTGSYDDLLNKPTLGTAAAADTSDFATAAQGAKADTAVQSVNSKTGTSITLTASDVGAAASSHTHPDATTSSAGFMSTADKAKLDSIQAGAQVNAVTSVAGKIGAVTLSASDISGLGDAATRNVGTAAGTVAAGDDGRIVGAVQKDGSTGLKGYAAEAKALGNLSGSLTPTHVGGNYQTGTITGALTINAPTASGVYDLKIELLIGAGAGPVTLAGFDNTDFGESFTTTEGDFFILQIEKGATKTIATVRKPT